ATNPGGAVFGGTLTQPALGGVATFAALTLDKARTGYLIQAGSGGLASATTSAINVGAATATQLVITAQPPTGVTAGSAFGLVVAAEDDFGNVDPAYRGGVTLGLAKNPGGTTLGGLLTVSASGGSAAFAGLTLDKVAQGFAIQASSGSLSVATT